MLEKNRDILKHAISRMPGRKPKASAWADISGSLDKIDSGGASFQHNSSLPVHKAPAGAWNKIAASLPATPLSFFTGFWGKLIIGTVIIGSLIIAYLLIPGQEESHPLAVSGEQPTTETHINEIKEAPESLEPVINKPSPGPQPDERLAGNDIAVDNNDDQEEIVASSSIMGQLQIQAVKKTHVISSKTKAESDIPARPVLDRSEFHQLKIITVDRSQELKKRKITGNDLSGQINYARDLNASKLKVGAFYAYKVFQDIEQEEVNIPSALSSFGFDLTIEKNKWFFRTAVSYVGWKEKGLYTFDYDQNQMIYQYNYVDSAYVDPGNGSVTYFTTPQEVYDSVPGMLNDQAVYEYKYLQIPVILGYRFLEKNKFSLAILGGAGMDIRLSGKQFIPVFDQEDASLNETSNKLKYRADQNWRILLGLEATFNVTPGWELFAEPGYQWYLKPVYAPDNIKGAGLLNVKLGLRYVF